MSTSSCIDKASHQTDALLLVGFGEHFIHDTSRLLWAPKEFDTVQTVSAALLHCEYKSYDMIVIDVDNIDAYGPSAVLSIRATSGCIERTIVAVTRKVLISEFDAQLERAGALVIR